jgi:hypothetical protein
MTEYEKFKTLLEYFVAHLEFCVTDQKVGDGYNRYIRDIKNFNRSGQGHKGQNIQNQIKEWESYTNGDICININPTVYKGRGCYLNWEDTAINVNALWDNDTIVGLKIVKDSYPISNAKDVVSYSIQDLGLLDNNPPNENLKVFFDRFNELIIQWNEKQKSIQEMKQIQPYIDLLKSTKNIILTGAPGTGKTFLAKEIAKQMIGVKTDEELEESGQFNFVQFHPSYDYTDFVEGLRPTQPDENGNIGFELKDGVFKEFCKKALEGRIDNFENSWNNLLNLVRDNLAKKQLTKIGSWEYSLSTKDSLKYSSIDTPSGYTFTITKQNVYNAYQDKKARPSGAFQKEMEEVVKFMKKNCGLKNYQQVKASQNKNYIFVIDEINRGEISKIFGELFFSIDPGYRGEKGRVQTQYANLIDKEDAFKDGFYVPENVHIIGTMNDIDRSVESFDFAMRRRFTWIEITAEQSAENMNLPEEIKVKMRSLNKKISSIEGLNSSYHIGGAYFLDSEGNAISEDKMDDVWKLRLRPLLKEYLRGMPDSENLLNDLKGVYGVKENDKTTSKSGEQNDNDNDETEQ